MSQLYIHMKIYLYGILSRQLICDVVVSPSSRGRGTHHSALPRVARRFSVGRAQSQTSRHCHYFHHPRHIARPLLMCRQMRLLQQSRQGTFSSSRYVQFFKVRSVLQGTYNSSILWSTNQRIIS